MWYTIEPSHSFGVCFHARVVIEVWHSFGARVFHGRMVQRGIVLLLVFYNRLFALEITITANVMLKCSRINWAKNCPVILT